MQSVQRAWEVNGIKGAEKARVLALYQMGHKIPAIAEQMQMTPDAVEAVIKEVAKRSRIVYVFADREEPATVIDVCGLTREVKITNLTDEMLSRAFGIKEDPGWEDYEYFLESRCMPRTRYGIREELKGIGLDFYDPFLIVQKTRGRVYEDHQYLSRMDPEWIAQYDEIMETSKEDPERIKRLQKYLQASEGAWKLSEGQY